MEATRSRDAVVHVAGVLTYTLLCGFQYPEGERPLYYDPNAIPEDPLICYELQHPGALDSRLIDWDGDGDFDVFTFFPQNLVPTSGMKWIRLFENRLNEPSLDFQEISTSEFLSDTSALEVERDVFSSPYSILFSDVNNDGNKDMIVINQKTTDKILYWGDHGGTGDYTWGDPVQIAGEGAIPAQETEKSDYIWQDFGEPPHYWDCGEQFSDFLQPHRWSVGAALGNLDGTAGKDMVVVYRDSRPRVFLNDLTVNPTVGATPRGGGFSEHQVIGTTADFEDDAIAGQLWPGAGNRAVMLKDLDGDRDLDCLIVRSSSNQNMQPAGIPAPCLRADAQIGSSPVVTLDSVLIYRKMDKHVPDPSFATGSPHFVAWYRLAPGCETSDVWNLEPGTDGRGSPSFSISVRDVNGDRDPDIVLPVVGAPPSATAGCGIEWRTRIYYNDGSGVCGRDLAAAPTSVPLPVGKLDTYRVPNEWVGEKSNVNKGDNLRAAHVALQDVNDDGLRDLVISHHQDANPGGDDQRSDRIWLQKASGGFERALLYAAGNPTPPLFAWPPRVAGTTAMNDNTRYIRMKDLDGDGLKDCVMTQFRVTEGGNQFNPLVFIHLPE